MHNDYEYDYDKNKIQNRSFIVTQYLVFNFTCPPIEKTPEQKNEVIIFILSLKVFLEKIGMMSGIPILFMNLHQVHLRYLSTLAKTTINDWGGTYR